MNPGRHWHSYVEPITTQVEWDTLAHGSDEHGSPRVVDGRGVVGVVVGRRGVVGVVIMGSDVGAGGVVGAKINK